MAILSQNSAARGAARAAGTPIVNARPVAPSVRAAPLGPAVNLSTRTYSGAAPKGAATSSQKMSGVDVANRFSLTPRSAQTAARAGVTAEQNRRQANLTSERERSAQIAAMNEKARADATKAADAAEAALRARGVVDNEAIQKARSDAMNQHDDNYTVVGTGDGGTKIIRQSGYDPSTGYYKSSSDVEGALFYSQKPQGTVTGAASGNLGRVTAADQRVIDLKNKIANDTKSGTETDEQFQARQQSYQDQLAQAESERDTGLQSEQSFRDKQSALDPDLAAFLKNAPKASGRIAAETGRSATESAPPEIQSIFDEHPEMAQIYEPLVEALARDDRGQAQMLMATLSRIDKQGERAAKVAQDAIVAAKDYHSQLATQSQQSYEIQMDIAAETKAQGEFEKAQFEHKQAFDISQKMDQAADNELIRRREAAAMGFTSDTNGLATMQKEARRAQDAISFLKSETNMISAEMSRRITSEYSLSVRDLAQKYDANLLQLDNSLNTSLSNIQSTLSMGDEERAKAYENAYQGYLTKVSENDKEAARLYSTVVGKLNDQAFELKKQKMADDRADERMSWQEDMADKRMKFQEAQLDKRLAITEGNANRRFELELAKMDSAAKRQKMTDEKKESESIRTDIRNIKNSDTVKTYKQIRDFSKQATAYLEDALASNDKLKLGAAKEAIGYMRAKGLDPMTGVRDGDYARLGKDQSWIDKFSNAMNAVDGGDLTGLSTDLVKVFTEGLELSSRTYRDSAMGEYTPAINRLVEFNNSSEFLKLDPRTVLDTEFVDETLLESYFQSNNSAGYNFDYGSYSGNPGSSEPSDGAVVDPLAASLSTTGMSMDEILGDFSGLQLLGTPQAQAVISASGTESVGDILSKLAPVTQGYDTPISEANYSKSTVKAWGGKHLGIDVAMPWGSYVPSVSGGTLLSVEFNKSGYGLSAIVKAPDGAEIRYSHLMAIDPRLKIGQEIQKGQEFAQVGNTGNVFSTSGGDGTHLDLRIRKGGKYIDPYSYYS